MALSPLQQFMVTEAAKAKPRIHRTSFEDEYRRLNPDASQKDVVDAVTSAMERLITRGLAVGYGYKTQHKLFLTTLRLTPLGRRSAKELKPKPQQMLPMFKQGKR
jgi:hypothetical protein